MAGSDNPYVTEYPDLANIDSVNADKVDGCDVSTDATLYPTSDYIIPTQKAVKTYADSIAVGGTAFGQMMYSGLDTATMFSLTYVYASRTLTVAYATGAKVWIQGTRHDKSSTQDLIHDDITGTWYYYFNSSGVLTVASTEPAYVNNVRLCSIAYVSGVSGTKTDTKDSILNYSGIIRDEIERLDDLIDVDQAAILTKAADSAVVHNTGNETVAGIKTFSSIPFISSGVHPPTTDYQLIDKKYVDDILGATITDANNLLGFVESLETTKAIDYVVLDNDKYRTIYSSGTKVSLTYTLPTLADNQGREILFFHNNTTTSATLTIDGEGSETISGLLSITLPKIGDFIKVKAFSTGWKILHKRITAQIRFNTYAGYGSTDTKIMRFTNVSENIGVGKRSAGMTSVFSENHTDGYKDADTGSANVEGLEMTVNLAGKYSIYFHYTMAAGAERFAGITVNSTELTTAIQSTDINKILSYHDGSISYYSSGTHSATLWLNAGDVIRPHTDGNAESGTPAVKAQFLMTFLE